MRWIRGLLHGHLQQRRLRSLLQTQRSIVHDRIRMLHGCMHDKHLRHGELPVRRHSLPKLLATELLPSPRDVPRPTGLFAESAVLPRLHGQRRKPSAVRNNLRPQRRIGGSVGLRKPKLRRKLPVISSQHSAEGAFRRALWTTPRVKETISQVALTVRFVHSPPG